MPTGADLAAALDHFTTVAEAVPDDRWEETTNCEPWTAAQLATHVVNSQLLWVGSVTGEELVGVGQVMKPEAVDDPVAHLHEQRPVIDAAWSDASVLTRDITGAFGTMSGADTLVFPIIDALCHSWDLASSTGGDPEMSDELVTLLESCIDAGVNDTTRSFGLFAEPVEVADDASPTAKAVARTGRG